MRSLCRLTRSWLTVASAWLFRRLAEPLDETLPLRLTLLVLLLRPPGEGAVRGVTWLLAGAALAVPALSRSVYVWLALALLVAARITADFPLADNHIYLLCYWCLGIGLTIAVAGESRTRQADMLRDTSRWLLGAAFLCAVVWKGVLSPEFLESRFFRVTLLTDDRFAALASVVGGLDAEQFARNHEALAPVPAGTEILAGPTLVEPPALRRLATLLTWGGFLLEAIVAIAFLCARPRWIAALRHPALLSFCVATYAIAPVAGFGWLLTVMGMAHGAAAGDVRAGRSLRLAYALVFALIGIYAETPAVPWILDGVAANRSEVAP